MAGSTPMLRLYGTRWPTVQRTGEGEAFSITWSALAKALEKPRKVDGKKDDQPIWTFGQFRDHYRDTDHHEASSALVLDYDACKGLTPALLHEAWGDVCYLAHTSWSHGPEMPKWRVILPLDRDATTEEYKTMMDAARRKLAGLDARPAAQGYFVPLDRGAYTTTSNPDGRPVDVDDMVEAERERAALENQNRAPRKPIAPATDDDLNRRYAIAALDNECREVASMPKGTGEPGGRHLRLFLAAKSMGSLEKSCGLGRGMVEAALYDAGVACGLLESEKDKGLRRTIEDGYSTGQTEPRAPAPQERKPRLAPRPQEEPPPIGEHEAPPQERNTSGNNSPSPRQIVDFYRCTDMGNAERFRDQHTDKLRFCGDLGGWYRWIGGRWERDVDRDVMELAKETSIAIAEEADACDQETVEKAIRKWASASEGANKLRNMIFLAESSPPFPVRVDQWDADPWMLGVINGVVDLRTGESRPAAQTDLMTHRCEIEYDPAAECPRWLTFMSEIMCGRPELVDFIQRSIGYSLTGSSRDQVLFFLHGDGANGKSTLLNVMRVLMGTYAQSIEAELLLDRARNPGSPSPELARLRGSRLVTTAEPNTGKRLDEAFIKQITGGDPVVARFLNKDPFEFTPQLKLWFAANHKPRIHGQDHGIWRRIRMIPFDARFDGDDADQDLESKLMMEAPGILRWAVEGCLAWQSGGLSEPIEVTHATQAYRDDQDLLAPWLDECCVVDSGSEAGIGTLWDSWKKWADGAGEQHRSKKWLSQQLDARGFKQRRTKSERLRCGLRVVGDASQEGMGYDRSGSEW